MHTYTTVQATPNARNSGDLMVTPVGNEIWQRRSRTLDSETGATGVHDLQAHHSTPPPHSTTVHGSDQGDVPPAPTRLARHISGLYICKTLFITML